MSLRPALFVLAAVFFVLCASPAIAEQQGDSWERHEMAGLAFDAPKGAEVTEQSAKPGVTVLAITRGDEILLITVYSGQKAPGVLKARAVHIEEVERKFANSGAPKLGKERIKMFKRNRDIWTMSHGPDARRRKVRVLALQRMKLTVVATWSTPAGMTPSKGFVRTLLEGLVMP